MCICLCVFIMFMDGSQSEKHSNVIMVMEGSCQLKLLHHQAELRHHGACPEGVTHAASISSSRLRADTWHRDPACSAARWGWLQVHSDPRMFCPGPGCSLIDPAGCDIQQIWNRAELDIKNKGCLEKITPLDQNNIDFNLLFSTKCHLGWSHKFDLMVRLYYLFHVWKFKLYNNMLTSSISMY